MKIDPVLCLEVHYKEGKVTRTILELKYFSMARGFQKHLKRMKEVKDVLLKIIQRRDS